MTEAQIFLFVITSLLIIATPGQDLVLVVSRGVAQGARGGVATAAGVSLGLVGHTLLATLGLGALLLASDFAFTLIKTIGAGYLIYLGVKLLRTRNPRFEIQSDAQRSMMGCFLTGALSNLSNPKITIFYFAYLPQFLSGERSGTAMLFILGLSFALLTFVVKGPIGFMAGRFSGWIKRNRSLMLWFNRTSGMVLIGLGLKLALERR